MWWLKSKTVWTGIIAIVGALAAYFTGEASLADTLQLILTALIGMFLRSGIEGAWRRG
jgi:uncharacterized membrane-anchored protein